VSLLCSVTFIFSIMHRQSLRTTPTMHCPPACHRGLRSKPCRVHKVIRSTFAQASTYYSFVSMSALQPVATAMLPAYGKVVDCLAGTACLQTAGQQPPAIADRTMDLDVTRGDHTDFDGRWQYRARPPLRHTQDPETPSQGDTQHRTT